MTIWSMYIIIRMQLEKNAFHQLVITVESRGYFPFLLHSFTFHDHIQFPLYVTLGANLNIIN